MSEGWVALLLLGALAAGVVVGQRVRAGKPRQRARSAGAATGAAPPPEENYTYGHTVSADIAKACGCS